MPDEDTSEKTYLSDYLIATAGMWQSGLEGDGYRFTNTPKYTCTYTNKTYGKTYKIMTVNNSCPDMYVIEKEGQSKFYTACPSNRSCLTLQGVISSETVDDVNNYICFGIDNKDDCLNNTSKYLYRIIGVFKDDKDNYYTKLIKYDYKGVQAWNIGDAAINWENSSINSMLNNSKFLTNSTYDYLQNTTWLNKIMNWTWSAANTQTYSINDPNYGYEMTAGEVYLHEMNRSSKTTTLGEWTTPKGRIGLMYASDYLLTLGDTSIILKKYDLSYTGRYSEYKNSWIFSSAVSGNDYEWTLPTSNKSGASEFYSWAIFSSGDLSTYKMHTANFITRPVFYLSNKVEWNYGSGTLTDPYIITP